MPRKQYNLVLICLIALSVVSAYLGLDLAADSVRAAQEMISPLSDAKVIEVEQIKEVPVEIQTFKHIDILKIVDAVEQLESSGGKNTNPNALHNICRSKGQENTWGYSGMKGGKCFDSYEQGRAWIAYWWLRKLEANDWNVQKCACIYNLGESRSDCPYAYKLMELIK